MGSQKSAAFKIKWLETHINSAMDQGKIINKEKLISQFCITHASTRRTCLEYLHHLENLGRIKIVGDEIWTPSHYEAQLILERAKVREEELKQEGSE